LDNIKKNFSIRDLENISGIKAHTIRIWEKRYNLLSPERSKTNIRYYSHQNLQKLLNIVLLNNNNYKISKISKMSDELINITARDLALNTTINDDAINSLKLSMFKFDKVSFNTTYNKLLDKKNFREIFNEVFIPFLEHLGLLWQTETILPVHEHFISNLITQKIQINTDELKYTKISSDNVFILFLPANEIHELGLLYLNYELVLRGHRTIYLGQNLPLNNLNIFFDIHDKITFVASMTVRPYDDDIVEYFDTLDSIISTTSHTLIAIGKKVMQFSSNNFKSQISLYPSISELLKEI
jgi:DNA-binding transcriptional MerR regulator